VLAASPVCAQEGVFLSEEQAPAAVFPTNAVPPPRPLETTNLPESR
jgi:hypothetical protein